MTVRQSPNQGREQKLSPIALFVYNRPEHTRRTLEELAANELASESMLYVYSDGPKHMALQEDMDKIAQVREIVRSQPWCDEVKLIECERNKGLADSIVGGVTEVVNRHQRVIVLEDDIVTSPGFLRYMNSALEMYQDDPDVMHVSAYIHPIDPATTETTLFIKSLSCWGWGTWQRAWDHYRHDVEDHLAHFGRSDESKREFNLDGHAHFFKQLQENQSGQMYTWAVRWYASWLRANGLSLFPRQPLVRNIGFDGSGVNCTAGQYGRTHDVALAESLPVRRIPLAENVKARANLDTFYQSMRSSQRGPSQRSQGRIPLIGKVKRGIVLVCRSMLKKVFPELADIERRTGREHWKTGWHSVASSVYNCELGKDLRVKSPYYIRDSVIGDNTSINHNSRIFRTTFGKFCSVGPYLSAGKGLHPVDGLSIHPAFYSTQDTWGLQLSRTNKVQEVKPIVIGNDVFIGMNVTILDGVTIGDGAVIGACALVTKDIPPYAIAVGVPARVIKYRFDEATVEKLLSIRWWDWPEDRLPEIEKYFFDVGGFVRKFEFPSVEEGGQ